MLKIILASVLCVGIVACANRDPAANVAPPISNTGNAGMIGSAAAAGYNHIVRHAARRGRAGRGAGQQQSVFVGTG